MGQKQPSKDARTEQGRQLAGRLYDYKLNKLENLSEAEKSDLLKDYPLLGKNEFQYVVQQVIETRRYTQERVGWQAVPHDITVLTIVAVTALANLQTAAIVGLGVLIFLEGLFQFYFNRRLYRILSWLVWLTYPAYLLLAYILFSRGYEWIWIAVAIALTWGGTFLIGAGARLLVRLFVEGRAKGKAEADRRIPSARKNK
jgi:hypothetical protein